MSLSDWGLTAEQDDEPETVTACPVCLEPTRRAPDRFVDADMVWDYDPQHPDQNPEWDCPICGRAFGLAERPEWEIHAFNAFEGAAREPFWHVDVWRPGGEYPEYTDIALSSRADADEATREWIRASAVEGLGNRWAEVRLQRGDTRHHVFAHEWPNAGPVVVRISAWRDDRSGPAEVKLWHPVVDPQALAVVRAFLADRDAAGVLVDYFSGVDG